MITIPIVSLDERLIHDEPVQGQIRYVHSKVIYLTANNGWLAAIFPKGVGNGPHYILVNSLAQLVDGVAQNEAFTMLGDSIEFANRLRLDGSEAENWKPASLAGLDLGWEHRLHLAHQYLVLLGQHQAQDILCEPEERFIHASDEQDWNYFEQAVRSLVGLGPGLTPAGDDFLAGFFGALAHLTPTRSGFDEYFQHASEALLRNLPGRTHPVAEFFSTQFAEGFTSQVFQEVLFSICSAEGEPALLGNIRRLVSFGATSGTEILRGMLAALNLAGQRNWI
jgi:hypothetical protein